MTDLFTAVCAGTTLVMLFQLYCFLEDKLRFIPSACFSTYESLDDAKMRLPRKSPKAKSKFMGYISPFVLLLAIACPTEAEVIRYDLGLRDSATGWIDIDLAGVGADQDFTEAVTAFDIVDWSIDFGDGTVVNAPPYEILQDFRGNDYASNGTNMHAAFPLTATQDELLLPNDLGARLVLGADDSTARWYTAIDWGTPNWWLQQPLDLSPHLLEWAETGPDQRWQTWTDTDGPSVIATRQQQLVALASHACGVVSVPEPSTGGVLTVIVLAVAFGSVMGWRGI